MGISSVPFKWKLKLKLKKILLNIIIMVDHFTEGGEGPVMHIGRRQMNIPQRWGFELIGIPGVFGHQKPSCVVIRRVVFGGDMGNSHIHKLEI